MPGATRTSTPSSIDRSRTRSRQALPSALPCARCRRRPGGKWVPARRARPPSRPQPRYLCDRSRVRAGSTGAFIAIAFLSVVRELAQPSRLREPDDLAREVVERRSIRSEPRVALFTCAQTATIEPADLRNQPGYPAIRPPNENARRATVPHVAIETRCLQYAVLGHGSAVIVLSQDRVARRTLGSALYRARERPCIRDDREMTRTLGTRTAKSVTFATDSRTRTTICGDAWVAGRRCADRGNR